MKILINTTAVTRAIANGKAGLNESQRKAMFAKKKGGAYSQRLAPYDPASINPLGQVFAAGPDGIGIGQPGEFVGRTTPVNNPPPNRYYRVGPGPGTPSVPQPPPGDVHILPVGTPTGRQISPNPSDAMFSRLTPEQREALKLLIKKKTLLRKKHPIQW